MMMAHPERVLRYAAVAGIVVLAVAPWMVSLYKVHVLNILIINIIMATSLNLIMGYAGQFAKANVAFMGLGAYTMGLLVTRADWSFWIAWPTGALLAAGVGTLVALPALRLRGLYLAIITISFVLIVHWSFLHARFLTGGASGFSVPHPNYFSLPIPNIQATYYLSLLTLLGAMWIVRNLVASGFGRALLCIAEQELVAPALGINVYRTKIAVFALSGLLAGFAGGLHAITLQFIDPQNFWLLQLVIQLCMVALGGLASILGSVLGASVMTLLIEILRAFKGLWEFAIGGILLLTIVFFPRGIAGLIEHFFPSLRERRHRP